MVGSSDIDYTPIVNISLCPGMCKFVYVCRVTHSSHRSNVISYLSIKTVYDGDFSLTFRKHTH